MQISKSFCLLMLVAAFLPLYPKLARAESGYLTFKPTQRQFSAMLSPTFKACADNSGGVTAAINECTWSEYARLDRRLNTSYQTKIARLSRTKVQRLRSEQRGWLATRDETCLNDLKEERENGGTIYSILLSSCQLEELQRRILWIESRR
jgi:uncharacterized protein YecT (DUF1311 family)